MCTYTYINSIVLKNNWIKSFSAASDLKNSFVTFLTHWHNWIVYKEPGLRNQFYIKATYLLSHLKSLNVHHWRRDEWYSAWMDLTTKIFKETKDIFSWTHSCKWYKKRSLKVAFLSLMIFDLLTVSLTQSFIKSWENCLTINCILWKFFEIKGAWVFLNILTILLEKIHKWAIAQRNFNLEKNATLIPHIC